MCGALRSYNKIPFICYSFNAFIKVICFFLFPNGLLWSMNYEKIYTVKFTCHHAVLIAIVLWCTYGIHYDFIIFIIINIRKVFVLKTKCWKGTNKWKNWIFFFNLRQMKREERTKLMSNVCFTFSFISHFLYLDFFFHFVSIAQMIGWFVGWRYECRIE